MRISNLCKFIVFVIVLFLSACATMQRDGPPSFYVDENKIPDAVPKIEPLSKLGNMPVYRIGNKKYYPMKKHTNYEAIGIASWYGTLFHNRRTSSGERYNMLGMTAAHRTLPLPTYVQVTNLKNGRQVIVKVNDRGPFSSNRILDVSYVAAKKLGMIGHGTALVKVKEIDPIRLDTNNRYPKPIFASNKKYLHARHTYQESNKEYFDRIFNSKQHYHKRRYLD